MTEPDKAHRGCLSCRWAEYLKTSTGRLAKHETIRCRYPASNFAATIEAFRNSLPASMRHIEISLHPHGMGADDGHDCPVWEPADGGKTA